MQEILEALLPWLVPPVVGAIIGYVTNDIAIRMLFRPLTEKRILGLRVPFTPGIIPKQRIDLAVSIGNMVSRELVNAETLQKQVRTPEFSAGMLNNISAFTGGILDARIADLKPDVENPVTGAVERIISSAVGGFLKSDVFLDAAEEAARFAVGTLYRQRLSVFLPEPGTREAFLRQLLSTLSKGTAKETVFKGIDSFLRGRLSENLPMKQIIPIEITKDLETNLRSMYPKIFEGVLEWLRTKSTRTEFEIRGRFLLKDILAKLNPLQRIIVNAGQYDKKLSEEMPEIVQDFIRSLEQSGSKEENIRRLVFSVGRFVRRWLQKTPAEINKEIGIDLAEKASALVSGLFDRLNAQETTDFIIGKILSFLEEHQDMTVADFSEGLLGMDEEDLSGRIISIIRTWRATRSEDRLLPPDILRFVSDFFRTRQDLTVRELTGFDCGKKQELDLFLVRQIETLLERKLPEIVAGFDVRRLVVDKINSLDVESVEKLLLLVIAKHLKWINLFGAILGALIGLLQVLLGRFV